ncbi:MAG: glycogen debranching N-terminal domain-containing protein [Longimicrobiales bacterium]
MPQLHVRPDQRYAWLGQSLLVVDTRGECSPDLDLSGFYFREARYLRELRLRIDGVPPWLCQAVTDSPSVLRFDYVHPELSEFGGGGTGQSGDTITTDEHGIPHRALGLNLEYTAGVAGLSAVLSIENRSLRVVSFDVSWAVSADFADIQEAQAGSRGRDAVVRVETGADWLRIVCENRDLGYSTCIHAIGPSVWRCVDGGLSTRLEIAPQQQATLRLMVEPHDSVDAIVPSDAAHCKAFLDSWSSAFTKVDAPCGGHTAATIGASTRDIASFPLLYGEPDEWLALQAGMPAYPALFGRDAITAGWQAAMLDRGASLDAALVRLGRLQSNRFDDWHDEQPGRIPYQVRLGPLARLDINPFGAYYADFASPLMFVVGLAHLYAWTGEKSHIARHWDTARRILDWARTCGDADGDGYLEYMTRSPAGTKNQGWKDSGDAIVYDDGSPVPSPIATCEIQGYWYAAQQLMAVLCWIMEDREDGAAYRSAAAELKKRFNRDWWVDEQRCIGLALDPEKNLVRAVTSNAAHCLTAGIVDDEHLPPLVGRLFSPDVFSGWGIRTLSTQHVAYDPISYHRGSVWAVENATLVFGLRRFGFDARAADLTRALFDLAALYPDYRIPETISGHARTDLRLPAAYPRANTPQLWNASGFTLLLHSMLGLQPVAPLELLIVDPMLPSWLPEIVLHGLRLGGATATLRFWRDAAGNSHADVLHRQGTFHLIRQPPPEALTANAGDRLFALADGLIHHRPRTTQVRTT